MITAIYDCRSKQAYIYRTNKIREIAGASKRLAHIYDILIQESGVNICNTWKEDAHQNKPFRKEAFLEAGYDGTVIYEGGGNLYVLFKDKETYLRANRSFSRLVLERSYSIGLITAWVETTDNFNADCIALYRQKEKAKNLGHSGGPCNGLPFVQIDRTTYLPLAKYDPARGKITEEAYQKQCAYEEYRTEDSTLSTELLDDIVEEKGDNSILAVIYIDGNDMGNKIKRCTESYSDYDSCVQALRKFSLDTNTYYVDKPIAAIRECLKQKNAADAAIIQRNPNKAHKYRQVIGGGDEITIICRGSDAKDLVCAYFSALSQSDPLVPNMPNTACAGVALFRSHTPFSDVYAIAEHCCEMGKKKSHRPNDNGNYVDFHFCHSSITNDLDTLRTRQEQDYTLRPYSLESGDAEFPSFQELCRVGRALGSVGRSNVKAVSNGVILGEAAFQFEVERILSRKPREFSALWNEYQAKATRCGV